MPPGAGEACPTLTTLCLRVVAASLPRFCISAGEGNPAAIEVRCCELPFPLWL